MRLVRARHHAGSTFEQPARTSLLPVRGRVVFDCVLSASVSQPGVRELSGVYSAENKVYFVWVFFNLGFI